MGRKKEKDREEGREIRRRMEALAAEIRRHNELYYNEGRPEIGDAEYDRLFRELRELERRFPDLKPEDSPTEEVGAPAPGRAFAKVEHRVPMLSLESLTSEAEVLEFAERIARTLEVDPDKIAYVCEPKLDGVSASLTYEGGRLVRGATRGDGTRGEEITRNLLRVRGVPPSLEGKDPPELVEVRGEVILAKHRFRELQREQEAEGKEPFRNARNAVAGSLKRVSPEGLGDLGMEFFFWGVGDLVAPRSFETYSALVEAFGEFGFRVSGKLEVVRGARAVCRYRDELEAERDGLDYEMDGIVAKVDSLEMQRRLGRTARAPRWAFAYKFAPRRAFTTVEDIVVQVGRTGILTPVVLLAPTDLAGVTVRRASLHNFEWLAEKDVRIGDRVEIERAGDVIPEVVRVDLDARPPGARAFETPGECPDCGEAVRKEGAYAVCPNIDCPAQVRQRIIHLASRRALDIGRLGPKYVDQCLEAGLIRRVEDVFLLDRKRNEILELERWGETSFRNLCEELDRARRPSLARFLFALGIRHVGEKVAADLADAFGSLEALARAEEEALCEVEGVGPKVAAQVRAFFESETNRAFLRALEEAGVRPRRGEKRTGGLTGRKFCFTGGLSSMTRDQARERVEALGASTASGISKRVTDVVIGRGAGSKREKAAKLGIRILEEEAFLALLESLQPGGEDS